MTNTLIVGESNPYGADPHFALYPAPDGSAGHRLAALVLGIPRAEYLRRFDRCNLLSGPRWSAPRARAAAASLLIERDNHRLVLLGRKVAAAFGVGVEQPTFSIVDLAGGKRAAVIPHPSGLCRVWNEPGAFERARAVVAALEECEGRGRCHGPAAWCRVCGDVTRTCDDPGCDGHVRDDAGGVVGRPADMEADGG